MEADVGITLIGAGFGPARMLDRARHMLITELSISRGLRESDVVLLLQKALDKASLSLPTPL